jgi:threonine dehydrogenase-like Zn-dependent dehydrogenase
MKALVKREPGAGHLSLEDLPLPKIGDDDLLIRISCCGICGSDLHIEDGVHPCQPPVVIGHEFSGVIEGMGPNVREFAVGDAVAFLDGWDPFPGVGSNGGFAEFMRAPASCMWRTPPGVSQEEASQFETIVTPMRLVRDEAQANAGDRVVVTGVGIIGLMTAAIAKLSGAHVTVFGTEADEPVRLPLARGVGADEVLVFNEETVKFVQRARPNKWIDASGSPLALQAATSCVEPSGLIVVAGLGHGPYDLDMTRVTYNNITIRGVWGGRPKYVREVAELIRE